jgi:YD repeat-containing protein
MTKSIVFICIFSLIGLCAQAQTSIDKLREIVRVNKTLISKTKTFTADRGGALCLPDSTVAFVVLNQSDSARSAKTELTYNAQGNILTQTNWNESQITGMIELSDRTTYQYNAQQVQILAKSEAANAGVWEPVSEVRTYPSGTSTTRVDSVVNWTVDFNTSTLVRESVEFFTYNTKDQPTKQELYNVANGAPELATTTTFVYNSIDSLASVEAFDHLLNEPVSKISISYNQAAHSSSLQFEIWDAASTSWQFFGRGVNDYDQLGRLEITEVFISFSGFFTLGIRKLFIYPQGNECVTYTRDFFTEDDITWLETGKTYYYYDGSTVPTQSAQVIENELLTFPSPFQSELQIRTATTGYVEVIDLRGQSIYQADLSETTKTVQTSAWPNGVYFVTLRNGNQTTTSRVVKAE